MLKKRRSSLLANEKGLATLEVVPVMIVIALLINFALGFFGIIHTGILNQMAARNYAFETFRHRSSLIYFHDIRGAASHWGNYNARVHGIASDKRPADSRVAVATLRSLAFANAPEEQDGGNEVHDPSSTGTSGVMSIEAGTRNEDIKASPVWIRPMYGICLTMECKKK